MGRYAKAATAVGMGVITFLQNAYPHERWSLGVSLGLTAILVYLVPNFPQKPPQQ